MKLKEKLAKEWFESKRNPDTLAWLEYYRLAESCFIAGFEKARALAIEEESKWKGYSPDLYHLGEEEVE